MHTAPWVEWLGYLASIVVLISLFMSSLVRLRWINMIGAGLFTLYGFVIDAYPVAFVNAAIVVIDLYYLYLHYSARERFGLVTADRESELFGYLIDEYRAEIQRQIPLTRLEHCDAVYYLMRDSEIAGILAGNRRGETVEVLLDFVFPRYRDYKMGRYLFVEHPEFFKERGIQRIVAHASDKAHADYLKKMGFRPAEDQSDRWEKRL